jgi:cobalamin biosynthesis Mg chelatase CobN
MGLMQRLFGPKRADDLEIRTVDWESMPTTPREAPEPRLGTVLIDSPDSGPEVAEVRPIGVVVPKNKQELMEELRKNYADVIELVRKVNTHLDDQGSRLAEQESRGRELMEIARQIPTLLATLPRLAEQNTALLGLVERLAAESAAGNEALRQAVTDQTRATAESSAALAAAIDTAKSGIAASVRTAADEQRRAGESTAATLNAAITSSASTLGEQLGSVQSAAEASARSFDAARTQLEARADELRKAMDQHRTWSMVATIVGVVALIGTGVVAVVLFMNR